MKNLHNIVGEIPDILWAAAYWMRHNKGSVVSYRQGYSYPYKTVHWKDKDMAAWSDTTWGKSSEDVVLNEWRSMGSPKTQTLRKSIVV